MQCGGRTEGERSSNDDAEEGEVVADRERKMPTEFRSRWIFLCEGMRR